MQVMAEFLHSKLSPIKMNGNLINWILLIPIYLIFKFEAESLIFTRCGIVENLKKVSFSRYFSHPWNDVDRSPVLLPALPVL